MVFPLVKVTYIRNVLNVEVGLPELGLQPMKFLHYSEVLPYYSSFIIHMIYTFLSIALQANSVQNLQFYEFLNLVFRRLAQLLEWRIATHQIADTQARTEWVSNPQS
jgi:hypothetical protein